MGSEFDYETECGHTTITVRNEILKRMKKYRVGNETRPIVIERMLDICDEWIENQKQGGENDVRR